MRNKHLYFTLFLLTSYMMTTSCKSTKAVTLSTPPAIEMQVIDDTQKSKLDRFISVDAVSGLQMGMTIDDVFLRLGSKPHNLISAQADGHHIYHYKYRLNNMEVPSDQTDNPGIEKKSNKQFYTGPMQDLYLVFNGTGKLEYLVTTQGGITENLLRDNNLLYVIRKDKDKYVSNPDPLYRNTNAAAFLPLTPCLDCDRIKNTISSDMNRNVSSNSQSESVSKASAANEASKGNACVAISTIMKELDDAQDIVDQMIAADNIKKTKDKIQKLVPLERKYTEKNRNISSLSKSLESNPQAKNCPGLQEMEARKSKVSADYAKRTASSGTKGLGGKLLSQTLGGL
jgi:hypothetical protein